MGFAAVEKRIPPADVAPSEEIVYWCLGRSSRVVRLIDREGGDLGSIRWAEAAGRNGAIRKEADFGLRQVRQFDGNLVVECVCGPQHTQRFSQKRDGLLNDEV